MLSALLRENRKTLALALPIAAGQVGQMLMGWADTLMVGRVGVVALGACAFANTIMAVALVFGFGIMSSVSVRASQAFGAGRGTGKVYRAGLALAAGLGVALFAAILALLPFLPVLGQPAEVNAEVGPFLILVGLSVIPAMLFTAGKNFAEALSRPWPPFWILLGGVALNVGLNFIFIFGLLGSPALGLTGAGVATLLARLASLAALLLWIHRTPDFRPHLGRTDGELSPLHEVTDLLRVGLPAGGQYLAEVGSFAFASLMMGWIGVQALAAHQIAITCAATAFMIPLGIGMAVTVRVGQSIGAGEFERVRPIAFGGLAVAVAVMLATAVVFLVFPRQLAGLFIADPAVIALTASLLVITGIFQVVDGTQIVMMNALRGMADVQVPFGIAVLAHWVVALPVAYAAAFLAGIGPLGVWIGLAAGLAVAALTLTARFVWKSSPARLAATYGPAHA